MYKMNKIIKISIRYFNTSNDRHINLNKIFLKDKYTTHSFSQILNISKCLSKNLLSNLNNKSDLNGDKIGVLCSNNYSYLCSILAIWMSNGVPFCLSKLYPDNLIDYFVNDSKCKLIINGTDRKILSCNNYNLNESEFYKSSSMNFIKQEAIINDLKDIVFSNDRINKQKPILLLYTSGTSGNKPKGCLITYENLFSSIDMMIQTYKWSNNDKMLSTLPLNHYSGLVYTLLTPFFVGAQVNLMPKFDAKKVWSIILNDDVNMFIGVPTIYTQLCDYYYKNKHEFPNNIEHTLKQKMRLIASGSAPLNVKTFNDWFDVTKYSIVERYGMTEIGMALSNSLDENKRIGGTVGRPIGDVKVRLVDVENDEKVLIESFKDDDIYYQDSNHLFGELQIKGPNVFREYLNKPDQTEISFTKDGWFRTGDTAQFLTDLKVYKIVGRTSVDVIKSGGYKISALDIEKEILAHPLIDDVAIMGLSDSVWGQRVFALIVLKNSINDDKQKFDLVEFKKWCKTRLPKYSVPTLVKIIDKMPRNQLGKVIKKELIKIYEQDKSISKI